ncbi:hypothetical protein [Eubacterium aggregans]|uniref:hypothetical protein n=1 Tax=Eubacterium aggregans TaxID=81409 RepID=UPI003F3E4AFF
MDKGRSNGWSFNLSNAIECEQIQNYIDFDICPNAQIVPVGNKSDPTNGMNKRFILCPEIENLEIVIEKVLSKQG